MKIKLIKNFSECDKILLENEKTLIYYSSKYMEFLKKILTDSEFLYFGCYDNKELIGFMPLVKKTTKYGSVINSLPFYGSHGGVIFSKIEAKEKLLNYFKNLVKEEQDLLSWTIIESPLFSGQYNNLKVTHNDFRKGQITELNAISKEDLIQKFHVKTRNAARRAGKDNFYSIINNSNEAMDFLFKIHKENMDRIGGKAKPENIFNSLQVTFKEGKDYNIFLAYSPEKKIVAAMLLLYFNKTVEYFIPATKVEYRKYQPLSMLIYEAMWDAVLKGYKYWNWGGTWEEQTSLYKFKKRWDAKDYIYKYYINVSRKGMETFKKLNINGIDKYFQYFYTLPFKDIIP